MTIPDLIKRYGWTYVPEHDILTGKDKMVVSTCPECWKHDYHETQFNPHDVLNIIYNEVEEQDIIDKLPL